jgi:hypothetical protein
VDNRLAEALFKVISHRDAVVVFISDRFRSGGRAEIADILDDRLLVRFLEQLPGLDHKGGWLILFNTRRVLLEHLSATIVRKQNSSNFVRAKLNPKVDEIVSMIETQRLDPNRAWNLHEAAVFLSIITLRVAIGAVDTQERFRIGVAVDYIHWLGSLMRSDVAAGVYVVLDPVPTELLDDLTFAAHQVADARRVLGEPLEVPIRRVNEDPWVAGAFKREIDASLMLRQGDSSNLSPRGTIEQS